MYNNLNSIKNNIISLKIDLETEYFSDNDLLFFKELSKNIDLPISAKIGGCEAVHDIFIAKKLGSKTITAPMIESAYALSKFVIAAKKVFDIEMPELFINIETISAYQNLGNILDSENAKYLTGIVIGRNDLAKSMGYNKYEVNNEEIFVITVDILKKAKQKNLKTIIGGNLTPKSISFLDKLPANLLDCFETRVVIFDYAKLQKTNKEESITKALEFEINFLENKKTDEKYVLSRIKELKQRIN
jgi:hypothetical protein